ncbi:hypothetical protein [Caballeronia sp. INDeC2]|uniref:hypothetical protein n=1 Tax=Caballeronia sp. INDeC2 TaxID=2921747 RepID=UPI0020287188|nr:hypothetical protein [Caballeronia sp. INDeC2]
MTNLIGTKTARERLEPRREPYFVRLRAGLFVGYVRDVCGAFQPREVLDLLMFEIRKFNFGFNVPKLNVPGRFRSKVDLPDDPEGQHPVLSWLYVEGKATWKELQEDYCLKDAFTMHRELLKSKVKAAMEAELAAIEAKAKAKGG